MADNELHSSKAEQSVLGALMIDNSAWGKIGFISKSDFYYHENKAIFNAIAELAFNQEPFDIITIAEILKKSAQQCPIGDWMTYTGTIAKDTPSAANIVTYAEIVRDYSASRKVVAISQSTVEMSFGGKKTKEILAGLIAEYSGILNGLETDNGGGIVHIKKIMADVVDNIEVMFESDGKNTGLILTPWIEFNERWGGFPVVGAIGIAGRPGMGKTTVMQNFVEWFATRTENKGKSVIIFSMDMSPEKLVIRFLSSLSKIDIKKLSAGKLENDDWARLTSAINLLVNTEIYIDGSSLTVDLFQSKVDKFTKEIGKPSVVVVDYLQQITIREMQNNPIGMSEEVSKRLKKLQKDWGVLLIELLQLNRNLESRPNKRPLMSDIRGSGQVEQDLEAIYFVYRDEAYYEDSPDKGVAEIIGGKVREGEPGTVRVIANLPQSCFENRASEHYDESDYR